MSTVFFVRPSIVQSSSTTHRNLFLRLADSFDVNATKIAWKEWRRLKTDHSSCWNQLRPCHNLCTTGRTNDEDSEPCSNQFMKNGTVSLRAFSSQPSLLPCSSLNVGCTPLVPLVSGVMSERTQMNNVSARFLSSKVTWSQVSFSTMPPTTSANSFTSTSKDPEPKTVNDGDIKQLPASERARALFKKYGVTFVGTYLGVYVTTLVSFYVAIESGILDPGFISQVFKVSKNMACETADIIGPTGTGASMNEAADLYADEVKDEMAKDKRTLVDVVSGYLESWDWTKKYAEKLSDNPHLANLAVAWFMVKFTEPVRLAAAVILTPKVAKALGKKEAKTEGDITKEEKAESQKIS